MTVDLTPQPHYSKKPSAKGRKTARKSIITQKNNQ